MRLCGEYYTIVTRRAASPEREVVFVRVYDSYWQRSRDFPRVMEQFPDPEEYFIQRGRLYDFLPSMRLLTIKDALNLEAARHYDPALIAEVHHLENLRHSKWVPRARFFAVRYGYLVASLGAFLLALFLLRGMLKRTIFLTQEDYFGALPISIWLLSVWLLYRHFADVSAAVFFGSISLVVLAVAAAP